MKAKTRKTIGMAADAVMYTIMLLQLCYVFTGNAVHEWMGMLFGAALVVHLYIKRKWFIGVFKRKEKKFTARRFADIITVILFIFIIALAFSSVGISRTIFKESSIDANATLHRWLGILTLTLAVIHGGMHGYFRAKNKKKAVIGIIVAAAIVLGLGFGLVPYLNRHFRTVEISYEEAVTGEKLQVNDKNILTVYFTRVGNTDFEENADAVSGASLLLADGELMGNTQLMADMLQDILGCDKTAITLTEYKYPSSYAETCTVGGKEIKDGIRPQIEPIDVSSYDTVILVYPIWWGTIPMSVESFLANEDLSGKDIYLIATQGSSGFASSTKAVQALVPDSTVTEGISVYCDDIPQARNMLLNWLKQSKIA